jgi:hypothetical protein
VQVIACVSLFALLAVNVGDRGGIFWVVWCWIGNCIHM